MGKVVPMTSNLKALSDAATQGEWRFDHDWSRIPSIVVGDVREAQIASFEKSGPQRNSHTPEQGANPLLIVALVNAYRSGKLVEHNVKGDE